MEISLDMIMQQRQQQQQQQTEQNSYISNKENMIIALDRIIGLFFQKKTMLVYNI